MTPPNPDGRSPFERRRGEPGTSGDRAAPEGGATGGSDERSNPAFANRVQLSHASARTTVRLALVFLLAAAVAVPFGSTPWLALHLFLAGGAASAISAVTVMLTVTWAAAPAPPSREVDVQRLAIAVGAVGVVTTRQIDALPGWSTGIPGALYVVGLVLLVHLLVSTARQGLERRFDVAVAFYVVAAVAALVAVAVGIRMASSGVTLELRSVHVALNLLGFVGLTMAGSLPFFAATVGRSRMAKAATPLRLSILLAAMAGSVVTLATGLLIESDGVVFVGLGAYLYGVIAVYCFLPRPTKRQLTWSGPRLVALWCGGAWWVLVLGVEASRVVSDGRAPFIGHWTHVLVVGAFAQILWGSLAYLVPMLRGGGHERLTDGFARTRSWVGFAGLNASALALAAEQPAIGVGLLGVTVADGAWRTLRVGVGRLPRPDEQPPSTSSGAPGRSVDPGPA